MVVGETQAARPSRRRRERGVAAAVGVLVLAAIGLWLWAAGSLLLMPALGFAVAFWLVAVLTLGLGWLVTDLVAPLWRRARRLGGLAWNAVDADEDGRRLRSAAARTQRRLRGLDRWVAARLRLGRDGLGRTIPALVAVGAASGLWSLGRLVGDPQSFVAQADVRIADAVTHLGLAAERTVMIGLTMAGRTPVMLAVTSALVIGFVLASEYRPAALLAAVTGASALGVTVLKAVVGRVRPGVGLLVETSSSFPSGHASAGLALALGVVVAWRAAGHRHWRALAALVVPVGMLIGYSRAYLGVHWASDVVGGWLVAILASAVVVFLAEPRPAILRPAGRLRRLAPSLGAVLAVGVFAWAALTGAGESIPTRAEPTDQAVSSSDLAGALGPDVRFSETLLGRRMEPVGLVITASEEAIIDAALRVGWSVADQPTVPRLLAVYWAGLRGRPDPTAPVTPTFLGGRVEDLALEKPVDATGDVRARHHARLWRLPLVTEAGCPVWVATASLDDRVEWTWRTVFPNHHIDPAIDAEQRFVVDDLAGAGTLRREGTVVITEPTMGTNAAGNAWFTDGVAAVLASTDPCRG